MTANTMQHGDAANSELFMPESVIFGTHGTSISRAESIMSSGFQTVHPGRVGFGAYFWFADNEHCAHAHKLAKQWHNFSERQQAYKKDSDRRCAVITTKISSSENEVFNMESPKCKADIRRLLEAKLDQIDGTSAEEREQYVCATYDIFIKHTEKHLGRQFKAILCTVPLPKNFKLCDPVAGYTGNPYVVVARDSSAIEILKCSVDVDTKEA